MRDGRVPRDERAAMTPRVLLVEDDPSLGRTLEERLGKERLDVSWAQTIAEGEAALAEGALGSRDRRRASCPTVPASAWRGRSSGRR